MPWGLIKNKLALPLTPKPPSIAEGSAPVIRVMMLRVVGVGLKTACWPAGTEKRSKLWNRLLPIGVPPVIVSWPETWLGWGRVRSGPIGALTWAQLEDQLEDPISIPAPIPLRLSQSQP
jgi:hypothetical protein